MHIRRLMVCLAPLAILAGSLGCIRDYQRRGTARPVPANAPREMAQLPPVSAPAPPTPPPLPSTEPPVAPPRSDAVTGIIPPIPNSNVSAGAPLEVADTPVVPATATDDQYVSAETRPPIRDRLEVLRKRAEERRDDRKDKRSDRKGSAPDAPSPYAPKPQAEPAPKAGSPERPAPEGRATGLEAIRLLVESSSKKWDSIADFEARLTKKEVVNGKQLPTDEILYRFRRQPMSVYMKTLSETGQGREVMYVKGQYGDKLHVVTGKGDNALVGAGYKTELDPDSRMATARSRQKVTEAGFSRPIEGLLKALEAAEAGKPVGLKSFGPVKRPEYPYPLDGVEMTLRAGQDPLMPKGGTRRFYFDSKSDSPAYQLPVLVTAQEPDGREVEYYCFDRFRLPANFPESDWNPSRLGKR